MGNYSYLQGYGIGEERRNRTIKWIILSTVGLLILAWILFLVFHDFPEKQVARRFIGEVNSHNYQNAYADWGCTSATPCRNYDYNRFLEDWGKQTSSPWKVASVDGCKSFVTVNVQAQGAELQSLAVERSTHALTFAPAPECQERKWRWKQFFQRIVGGGRS
jgi:hypothetical protein